MFSKLLVVLAAAAIAVNAQGTSASATASVPGSLPSGLNLSPCAQECIVNSALADGCTSPTDLTCLCTNDQFQVDAGFCIQTNCPEDLQAALQLQQQECAAVSLSPTGASATPSSIPFTAPPSSASGTASSSVASGASSASASSGASASTPSASASSVKATSSGPTGSSAASSAASSPTTSSPANSLVANGGVAAIVAVIAGFLAI